MRNLSRQLVSQEKQTVSLPHVIDEYLSNEVSDVEAAYRNIAVPTSSDDNNNNFNIIITMVLGGFGVGGYLCSPLTDPSFSKHIGGWFGGGL